MDVKKGFTLIELMIVVAIIGVLAAVAVPKFADLIRKSNEGATKGNLGAIRSAISVYYGEMEGWFPVPLGSGRPDQPGTLGYILMMENGKYIKDCPNCYALPYHSRGLGTVMMDTADESGDPGWWGYERNAGSTQKRWGDLWVNCTHTDSKRASWGSY